jgi:hypothetical protein
MELMALSGVTILQWLVYSALLWAMIKVQKLQYHGWGLLGASLLATLVNLIPVVGCYLSWAVLVLCLWKITRSDIVPDVVFTVGVAGAIMFCLNLWAFGALIGEIRPDLAPTAEESPAALEAANEEEEETVSKTSPPAVASLESQHRLMSPAKTVKESVMAAATNTIALVRARASAAPAETPPVVLKGVVLHATQPSAMILAGGRYHTIQKGDLLSISLAGGKATLHCKEISSAGVFLTLNDAQEITLRVR